MVEQLLLKDIARAVGGTLAGDGELKITAVTTDSRAAAAGTLFIALKGERADGHDFIASFLKDGTAAISQRRIEVPAGRGLVLAADTRRALGDLARYYRSRMPADVVAVTGSVGKTSTKDMLYAVVSEQFSTLRTEGNFNNDIGLPLTLLRLDRGVEKAIIEMGMNHAGEIGRLAEIAQPRVAVITNIGTAHIGNLGSRENILKAKLEVLAHLPADGLVLLNGDDPLLWSVRKDIRQRVLYYGIENGQADLRGTDVRTGAEGSRFVAGGQEFCVPVPGVHHVYNALAAVLCGLEFGMELRRIAGGVARFEPSGMRQKRVCAGGVTLIEDCYNASTDSMCASLQVLRTMKQNGRCIAVLGDMLEQGAFSEQNHRAVGRAAAACRVDLLVTVGTDAAWIAQEAAPEVEAVHFADAGAAAAYLHAQVRPGDVVLFKASRGMRLEQVSAQLQQLLGGNAI